jgi:hypothetical protein
MFINFKIMLYVIITVVIMIIVILIFIYYSKKKTEEPFLLDQMDYPYRLQFGRQVNELKSDMDGYYVIKLPLKIPGKPFVMASCNWNMYTLTKYEYYMNVKIFNTFPIDSPDEKYRNSFRFKLMPYKWWPEGGVQFISIHKNPNSIIDMIDMPYLIDYGSFSYKSFPTDPIYFSTAFHSVPTIVMPQIGQIVEVTRFYFRFSRLSYEIKDPPPFIEWLAILENPGSKITKEDLPYLLDFGTNPIYDGINTIYNHPSYPLMLNGQTADIPGLIPFQTKFMIPPTIINGSLYNPVTQISTEYFTTSHNNYDYSWLAIQMKNQDPYITPNIKMNYQCAKTEFIDPTQCGSHIYDYPATCPTHVVSYIPTLTFDYLPTKDYIPPDPPLFLLGSAMPYLVDVVTLTLNIHVDIHQVLYNEIIEFSTSSDRPGYITVSTITPIVQKVTWLFPIYVDLSGAIYSRCASMGNIMFCVNTGNVDLIRFQLILSFQLLYPMPKNFQYYVQLNQDDNLIYGPFADVAPPIMIGAGAGKCGAFNVKCMVDRFMNIHCKDIVNPIAIVEKETLLKDINKFCDIATEGLVGGCFLGMGGVENPLSYAICVPVSYIANDYCKKFMKKEFTVSEMVNTMCDVFNTF